MDRPLTYEREHRPTALRPAIRVAVPAWIARIVSHLCDLAHFSPFSFGHLELLRRDNVPAPNLLPLLLGRAPTPAGNELPPSRKVEACEAAARG